VSDKIKEEEKVLKKLESDKNQLTLQKENILSSINQYERNTITKQDDITLNKLDLSNKVIQIQAQKELILQLANAGEEAQEEAEKVLKDMEKDFKKLQKANENLHQDIAYNESQIRLEESSKKGIESQLKFLQLDIDDQEYKLRKLQQKLEDIQ
jgi:predicted phage gp36 major capsid-like protein